jgi:hypothetical protein
MPVMTPALNSIASTIDVFPAPEWDKNTTLRILSESNWLTSLPQSSYLLTGHSELYQRPAPSVKVTGVVSGIKNCSSYGIIPLAYITIFP